DARTGREEARLKVSAPINVFAISPDESRMAVASFLESEWQRPGPAPDLPRLAGDGTLRLVDARSGAEILTLGKERAQAPIFGPDGTRLFSVGVSGEARMYVTRGGKELFRLRDLRPLGQPSFSPDGRRLAAVGGGVTR